MAQNKRVCSSNSNLFAIMRTQVDGVPSDLRRLLLVIVAYAAFFLSGCGGALLRCLPLLGGTVVLHAALRRAPTEYLIPRGEALGVPFGYGGSTRAPVIQLVVGSLTGFGKHVNTAPRGACRHLLRMHGGNRDSYRLFKELFWAAKQVISDSASYHWCCVRRWSWGLSDLLLRRRSGAALA